MHTITIANNDYTNASGLQNDEVEVYYTQCVPACYDKPESDREANAFDKFIARGVEREYFERAAHARGRNHKSAVRGCWQVRRR